MHMHEPLPLGKSNWQNRAVSIFLSVSKRQRCLRLPLIIYINLRLGESKWYYWHGGRNRHLDNDMLEMANSQSLDTFSLYLYKKCLHCYLTSKADGRLSWLHDVIVLLVSEIRLHFLTTFGGQHCMIGCFFKHVLALYCFDQPNCRKLCSYYWLLKISFS